MKILIHAPHYNPSKKPISRLLNDLVKSLSEHGHEIIVFTARFGQMPEPTCGEKIVRIYNVGGLSDSTFLKLLDYLSFYLQSTIMSLFFYSPSEGTVTIFRSGFGISTLAAYISTKLSGSRIIFWALDRHPDILFENMFFTRTYLFKMLKTLEIGLQKRIPTIIFETRSDQKDYLDHQGVQNSTVVRTWHEEFSSPPRKPKLWDELGLNSRKVLVFSGNIGNSIDLDAMLGFFRERPGYTLLVIGKGSNKRELMNLVAANQVDNVFFTDYLIDNEYLYVLRHALYGIISLKPGITIFSSKLTSYAACGLPILAFVSDDNEMATLVREHKCGLVINKNSEYDSEIRLEHAVEMHRSNLASLSELFDSSRNVAEFLSLIEGPQSV